jgi:hypothetical protein
MRGFPRHQKKLLERMPLNLSFHLPVQKACTFKIPLPLQADKLKKATRAALADTGRVGGW